MHTLFCLYTVTYTDGEALSVAYLAPSVTPWRYISAALNTSYHNPGIRLIEYDTDSLDIVDYTQYYFDLNTANQGESSLEFSLSEVYMFRVQNDHE